MKKKGKNPWDTDSDPEDDVSDFDDGSDNSDFVAKKPTKSKRAAPQKRARGISSDAAGDDKPKTKKPMKQCKLNFLIEILFYLPENFGINFPSKNTTLNHRHRPFKNFNLKFCRKN